MNKLLFFIYFFLLNVIAHSQSADFTYQSPNGLSCAPATIQFTQTCTGNYSGFVWNFGNGAVSNSANPSTTYASAGTYMVKLIAIYDQYTLEITKAIVINPSITASIGYDRNFICKPGVINFNAASSGNIASYTWNFGDGSAMVTSGTNTIAHNFLNFGTYNVTMKATDVSGCFASANSTVAVKIFSITGTSTPVSGCVPVNVSFNSNAFIPANSVVTNYAWNFNDGSPVLSTVTNNTNHIYNVAGSYTPSLIVTTNEGCTNNFTFSPIAFGVPPTNLIAYPAKTILCGSEQAVLISKALNADSYKWDFGDGTISVVPDTITQHKYKTLGVKNITVTPFYNGCAGISASFQVTVTGVIANYDYSNTCINKKAFSFNNTSQGNISASLWDFGDGTPTVNTLNASHTFPSTGSFNTSVTVTDNVSGCSDKFTGPIYTADPSLINPDSAICKYTGTTFSLVNNYNNPTAQYTWNVAGLQLGPYGQPFITAVPMASGNFNNFVVIDNGFQYCGDTIRLNNTILIKGPVINFTSPDTICLGSPYTVTNNSQPFLPADSVKIWYWNFGVGANDTIYQPSPYMYANTGIFNVKFVGIDKNGCKDSLTKTVTVLGLPFLQVIPGVDTLCFGTFDPLIAFHSDNIVWSPANLVSCATCDTVMVNPAVTTKFFVTATNALGCTAKDSVLVKVYSPFVAIPLASDIYICLNDSDKLLIDPPGKKIMWSPANGLSNTNKYAPFASPKQTTKYTATLMDSVGCFTGSTDITVHVKSLPTVNAGPDKVYPYYSTFSINPAYSNNVSLYNWTPSSLLNCNNCATPTGIATYTTNYILKVTSDSGCIAKDTIQIFVDCKDANILMPTAFTPNRDGLNDFYFPLTRGIKTILKFSIYNRSGQLVYEARNFSPNNKAFGWNGKLRGLEQSSAVYVYFLDALCDVGETLQRRGSFVLIK